MNLLKMTTKKQLLALSAFLFLFMFFPFISNAATFGYTSIGSTQLSVGSAIVIDDATINEDGTITSISLYGRTTSGGGIDPQAVAIYSDNIGVPTTKLAEDSGNSSRGLTNDWYSTNISYSAVSGTTYWLAGWVNSTASNYVYADLIENGDSIPGETFENWPDPIDSLYSSWTKKFSIYATYTVSGAPAVSEEKQSIIWFE